MHRIVGNAVKYLDPSRTLGLWTTVLVIDASATAERILGSRRELWKSLPAVAGMCVVSSLFTNSRTTVVLEFVVHRLTSSWVGTFAMAARATQIRTENPLRSAIW